MHKLTVIKRPNGDTAIYINLDGSVSMAVVTLQKDGKIHWASLGPVKLEDALTFSDAMRMAVNLSSYAKYLEQSADSE